MEDRNLLHEYKMAKIKRARALKSLNKNFIFYNKEKGFKKFSRRKRRKDLKKRFKVKRLRAKRAFNLAQIQEKELVQKRFIDQKIADLRQRFKECYFQDLKKR